MVYPDGQPSKMRKEEWLRDEPIFQNTAQCDKIFHPDFALSHLHFHEFVEISIVVEGSGVHCIWNKVLECRKGDIYILNVGVPHEYFAKDENGSSCAIFCSTQATGSRRSSRLRTAPVSVTGYLMRIFWRRISA